VAKFKCSGTTVTNQEQIKSGESATTVFRVSSRFLCQDIQIKIYESIILSVVLYGFETWSLTLTDEHGLRVFENRALKSVFGPKREEVAGGWRTLHNEELRNFYTSPNIM
jgi:hypothetical protein